MQRHCSGDEVQGTVFQRRASQPGDGTAEDEEHGRCRDCAKQRADLKNEDEEQKCVLHVEVGVEFSGKGLQSRAGGRIG